MSGKMFWTAERDEALRKLFGEHGEQKTDKEIGVALRCTRNAVSVRRQRLGLKRKDQPTQLVGIKGAVGPRHQNKNKRWSSQDDMTVLEIYRACRRKGWSVFKRCAKAVERTPIAVYQRLHKLGAFGKRKLGALKNKVFPVQTALPMVMPNPTHKKLTQLKEQTQKQTHIRCSAKLLPHTINSIRTAGLEHCTTVTVI